MSASNSRSPSIVTTPPTLASQYWSVVASKLPKTPLLSLTTGLSVFLLLIYFYSFYEPELLSKWSLSPTLLLEFQPHRLSTYPLVHKSFFHLFFNVITLYHPLSEFESRAGTVHTGIVLNLLATVTGIFYCIVAYLFCPDTQILGASGWAFSFITYYTTQRSKTHKITSLLNSYDIKTVYLPFIYLVICLILAPGSSFLGHLAGIFSGYALSKGWLEMFTVPPFLIVDRIESYLDFLIKFLPKEFKYVKEIEVKAERYIDLVNILPLHANSNVELNTTEETSNEQTFLGSGNVLGSEL